MKPKKKPGGVLGRNLQHKSKIRNFAKTIVAILILMIGVTSLEAYNSGKTINAKAGLGVASIIGVSMFRSPGGDEGGGGSEGEKELLKTITEKVAALHEEQEKIRKAEQEALDTKIKALESDLKKLEGFDSKEVKSEIVRMAIELKALKEKASEPAIPTIRNQVKAWQEANKEKIAQIKNGQKADLTPFELKLNNPMLPSNTYNGSAYLPQPEFAPGAVEIVRVQPTFWDYIKKGVTSASAYVWVNKKNPEGAAGFIGPGVAKPGVSFEIGTEISVAKKVAAIEKVATELLEDIDGMTSWIEQELAYQLRQKINTTLMTGVNSSTVPAGIQTISVPYSLTTVKTTNPNNWDAVIAAVAQLRSGNLQGPVTAFMNPIDLANLKLAKAVSQGQYLNNLPELGATIVEDNNIPVGFVQVALLDYYKILIYKGFTVTWGWEMDDLTKNLLTVVGELRLHQFFSENHTGAFVYDALQDIKDAIVQA